MEKRITVYGYGRPIYDIVLSTAFEGLKEEIKKLDVQDRRVCIVTDSIVGPLYLEEVETIFSACCKQVISFQFHEGESHKNLKTVENLYETLILHHFDRKDMLVALGGGVVGDL